jgi:hypothetical protein
VRFTNLILALCLSLEINAPAAIGLNRSSLLHSRAESPAQGPDKYDDDNCKQPVCWAGDSENKSCYVCEYGKPTQHVVCTSKGSTKDMYYNNAQAKNRDKNHCPAPAENMKRDKDRDSVPNR